jgi:hypothetical protein
MNRLLLLVVIFACSMSPSYADERSAADQKLYEQAVHQPEVKRLKGAYSVWLMVGVFGPGATTFEADGISKNDLRILVESRLRQAGIPIWDHKSKQPVVLLEADINVVKIDDMPAYAFESGLRTREGGKLDRNPKVGASCITWERGAFGVVRQVKSQDIRQSFEKYLDEFINDYFTANPRKD